MEVVVDELEEGRRLDDFLSENNYYDNPVDFDGRLDLHYHRPSDYWRACKRIYADNLWFVKHFCMGFKKEYLEYLNDPNLWAGERSDTATSPRYTCQACSPDVIGRKDGYWETRRYTPREMRIHLNECAEEESLCRGRVDRE